MVSLNTYAKPPLDAGALVARLQAKGLIVSNVTAAQGAIERIGYFRLLIYMRPFQGLNKQFINNCTFDDIIEAYEFDRELRLLCLDAIERCEVALRGAINDTVAVQLGSHFYLSAANFDNRNYQRRFLTKVQKSDSVAIAHYKRNYSTPPYPPVWAALEAISFGTLSKFFADLTRQNRRAIAQKFGIADAILVTWFHCISVFRNICAHHHRVWNAKLTVKQPRVPNSHRHIFGALDQFQTRAVILYAILAYVDQQRAIDWRDKLQALLTKYNRMVKVQDLGFSVNDPFWTM